MSQTQENPSAAGGAKENHTTHFGFQDISEADKTHRVREVFKSVAPSYDLMNDLMSGGMHRLWKSFTVDLANVRAGERVLDVASGSGDLALAFAKAAGPKGQVWQTDINEAMLKVGRDRLLNAGLTLPLAQCDAEKLPFADESFHLVSVAFGLRNMTHKDRALAEMDRRDGPSLPKRLPEGQGEKPQWHCELLALFQLRSAFSRAARSRAEAETPG